MEKNLGAPEWDLSDLYSGCSDPKIKSDLDNLRNLAENFSSRYQGNIKDDISPAALKEALLELEHIYLLLTKVQNFAFLLVSADTSNESYNALLDEVETKGTEIKNLLLFFEIDIYGISENKLQSLLSSGELKEFKHYLGLILKQKPFHLSLAEEKILNEKAETSGEAIKNLFQKLVTEIEGEIEEEGKIVKKDVTALVDCLHSHKRDVRKMAADELTSVFKANGRQFTDFINYLIRDKAKEDKIRSYNYPEEARHLSNEISKEAVDALESAVEENYDLAERYYELKKKVMGISDLYDYDRYAPFDDTKKIYNFEEAKKIVLEAYHEFSPKISSLASDFFEKKWIDAVLKKGKRGGAYCMGVTPDVHPYVFLNFSGSPREISTLAHELGHGIHYLLASGNNLFDYSTPLITAETASVFGEMLVFESLKNKAEDNREKLFLIMHKIEDTIATVFRQMAMFKFEKRIHYAYKKSGRLFMADLNKWWNEEHQAVFGRSLTLREEHEYWWMYVSHIFEMPFYVYAYAFGELLTLSLYARHKKREAEFPEKFINFLSSGGSRSPEDLLAAFNISLADKEFWKAGCVLIGELIREAEKLYLEAK